MSNPTPQTDSLVPRQVVALRDLLSSYCGVFLDDTRTAALEAATSRRARTLGQAPGVYAAILGAGSAQTELQQLAELLLNHETQFFRHRPHMLALREAVLPELHRRLPPGVPLRLWSAGCATGEEPYSLAIAALEALGDPPGRPIEVWGTDLSEAALARARLGVYRGRSLANLTPQQRARYFTARGADLVVSDRVRKLVSFEQLNLLDPFPGRAQGAHIIFCQNVTIYFQVSTCRALMERFYQVIADGGALFLGFSETLWNIFDRFRWREVGGSFVYYKEPQEPRRPPPHWVSLTPVQGKSALTSSPIAPGSRAQRPSRPRLPVPVHSTGASVVQQGRELLDAGRAEAALELFYGAPLVGVHAPAILALAARAHADRGDLDLAAAEARRALELNPLTTEAYLLIGLVYARQGRHSAAITQLERARSLDTESPVIAFHLAECYRQTGRAAEALREYRNTIRKLSIHPPDRLIDGVAAGWLSDTCRRYVTMISGEGL